MVKFNNLTMGIQNSIARTTDSLFQEYECNTGRQLLRAIRADSKERVAAAIETVRKEYMTAKVKNTHEKDFENMTRKVMRYLTRYYDVGEGMLHKKTPLQLAEECEAIEVVQYLTETLETLKRHRDKDDGLLGMTTAPKLNAAVGKIDKDRAELARERLKEYRDQYNDSKQKL